MDILYNLLNSLYIAQWRTNYISRPVVDLESIIYHGLFDSKFESTINYDIKVDDKTLLTFGKDDTHLNEEDVRDLIASKTFGLDIDKVMESIKNNVTIKTNLETTLDNEFRLDYSVGKSIDLNKQYSKILQMSSEGYKPGKNDVYVDKTISTLDALGNPLNTDTVYISTYYGFTPYAGRVEYPNEFYTQTNKDYFRVMSGYDRKKPAMITINPKNGGTQLLKFSDALDRNSLTTIHLGEVIYPNNKIWES